MKFRSLIILIIILLFSYLILNNKLKNYYNKIEKNIELPNKIYLIKDEEYSLENKYNIKWQSKNNKILKIENNKLIGLQNGITKIYTKLNKRIEIEVEITDLLIPNKNYNINKEFLSCNKYNKEENDLIDKVLEFKINSRGYKTRAGVVEAARFLTLNFPYKINYFYENGRGTTFNITDNVEGEGRYYNKGLYLDESRFNNILYNMNGPATWGCEIYSNPIKEYRQNGLDCSGFISWTMINAGYNPGDIGAGITDVYDYTDLGYKKEINNEVIESSIIKVGDLLHSNRAGGHIAMIVGIDKNNYYVAESIWYSAVGVVINTYSKKEIQNNFNYIILMDKYYIEDGNLKNMWQ